MHRYARSSFVLALCTAPLLAQEAPPGPAPELKKLAVYEGTWVGSGTAIMAPGQAPSKWTSRTTYAWAMNGHFLEEFTVVESEGMPAPMVFHGYLGWDRENERYVAAMATNSGESNLHEMHWLDDGTVVKLFPVERDGVPGFERSVSKIDGDTLAFEMSIVHGAGPMVEAVEGTLKRVEETEPFAATASHSLAPAPAEMGKLEKICGTYEVKGTMIPAPGAPSMEISGEEVIQPIFGGNAISMKIHGQPGDYEAWGCMTWNEAEDCYKTVSVDNMGMIHEASMYWVDDTTLVSISAGKQFGMPSLARTKVHLNEDGSLKNIAAHAVIGAMEPKKNFEATYEKK